MQVASCIHYIRCYAWSSTTILTFYIWKCRGLYVYWFRENLQIMLKKISVDDEGSRSVSTPNMVTTCPVLSPARIISRQCRSPHVVGQKCGLLAIIVIVKIFTITRMITCSIDRLYCTQYIHTIQHQSFSFSLF